jgi:hypothetical protein
MQRSGHIKTALKLEDLMDLGTMIRELDEVIARAQSTAAREIAFLNALPDCGPRRRKQKHVRAMRDQLQQLRHLRNGVRSRRRLVN